MSSLFVMTLEIHATSLNTKVESYDGITNYHTEQNIHD